MESAKKNAIYQRTKELSLVGKNKSIAIAEYGDNLPARQFAACSCKASEIYCFSGKSWQATKQTVTHPKKANQANNNQPVGKLLQ